MRGCRPPAADCLRASAQRTLEAQNTGVDFTRPAVKQVYGVITPDSGGTKQRSCGIFPRMLASGVFIYEKSHRNCRWLLVYFWTLGFAKADKRRGRLNFRLLMGRQKVFAYCLDSLFKPREEFNFLQTIEGFCPPGTGGCRERHTAPAGRLCGSCQWI